jgi:hypothetical protein
VLVKVAEVRQQQESLTTTVAVVRLHPLYLCPTWPGDSLQVALGVPFELLPLGVNRELRVRASRLSGDPVDRMVERGSEVPEEVTNHQCPTDREFYAELGGSGRSVRGKSVPVAGVLNPRWQELLSALRITLGKETVAFSVREGSDLIVKRFEVLPRSVELEP